MWSLTRAALLAAVALTPSAMASYAVRLTPYRDPCPFGYGTNCGGGGEIDSATKAKVANILEGILKNLSSKKALVQDKQQISKVAAPTASSIRRVVAAPVRGAIQSLLSRLQTRGQAGAAQTIGKLISTMDPSFTCESFDCGSDRDQPIDDETKEKVAAILEGIIKNLSSHQQ
eukprot:CAMPEP_0171091266 /NCGR_PEP_ID=MMETSP0766_2-20121228/32329_1 /TAXON_ID=439317 /ORGANISM="Gambierdiscus australes, Strain CAWD 149" /LENGTH=172 /DNA_ID=CAMNT_0011549349 /DNA_START=62 /DNA_END=580 /DNA_ORIENTATION=-